MKRLKPLTNQSGATAVIVAISIVALVGFTALAIDIGNLLMVRNQLQNAADSGALAGAAVLYDNNGTSVNDGANQVAYDMATSNAASSTEGEIPVEVNWEEGNEGDVQRGHWSFETRTFTPNDTLLPTDLWDYTTDELDTLDTFINAVRVKTRRESAPAASFFAGIFGYDSFTLSAEAVAYLGFAGKLKPGEVDQPIAICTDSIKQDDEVSCNIGRMINSSTNSTTSNTGGWTDFNQEDNPCSGTNSNHLKELTCNDSGNPDSIILGQDMATDGGAKQSVFNKLIECWEAATNKTELWPLALSVIECPDNNVGTCEEVRGLVYVNVVWITEGGEDPGYKNAPTEMDSWSYPADEDNTNGEERWSSFVDHFSLKNADGSDAPYQKKSIYFLPDCTPHEPKGTTGGENFGVMAEIPVLVNRPNDN